MSATIGPDSGGVAIVGVLLPFLLGLLAAALLIEDVRFHTSLFLGATLVATSVGITATVLR